MHEKVKQFIYSDEQQASYKALWYRALTLTERMAVQTEQIKESNNSTAAQHEIARRRLQRWKDQPPFTDNSYFSQRLEADTLTEENLLALLAEAEEDLQIRLAATTSFSWLLDLQRAFEHLDKRRSDSLLAHTQGKREPSFLDTFLPLIYTGLEQLNNGIQELVQIYAHPPFDSRTLPALLINHIPERIMPQAIKTLVLELNIARIQGNLYGETAKERCDYFIEKLLQPSGLLPLLEEYPVLARQLVETINLWVSYELELLTRLCNDWPEICHNLSPRSDPGEIIAIHTGQGDTHRSGRSVAVLICRSGLHLVYKPRSLAVDAHFQELLSWVNQQGFQPAFQTMKIITRDHYGWTEFIAARPCSSTEQVERFYQRQGGYLALLYALEATDFHAENLIAAGEHPFLIDLEALFHAAINNPASAAASSPAQQTIEHSVLHTSLLPQRIWSNRQSQGIDISGLGGTNGQISPTPMPSWTDVGTDNMQLHLEPVEISLGAHRPTLDGQEVETATFCDAIITGFSAIYQLLIQHHTELLNSILPSFANDEIRCLVRPTRFYVTLLTNSYHPEILHDALDRDRFFDRLWIVPQDQPYIAEIIAAERSDLLQGDIPLFTTTPGSHNLMSSQRDIIPDFFTKTGFAMVEQHLQSFDARDLQQQIWFIKAAFASCVPATEQYFQHIEYISSCPPATPERLLEAAKKIGDRLDALALRQDTTIEWLGLQQVREQAWQIMPTNSDLYNGTAGIALFLAYLGKFTATASYTTLARQTLDSSRRHVYDYLKHPELCTTGAFTGLGSFIYLLTHLGALWSDQTLYREAKNLVHQISPLITNDQSLDIVHGSAGYIATLLGLDKVSPSADVLAAALQCGDHLIACAQHTSKGLGWIKPPYKNPLTGFAQGNAGIIWSLFKLSQQSGEERFYHTAVAALEYERNLYSEEKRNWPDVRQVQQLAAQNIQPEQPPATFMVNWDQGAPGIALARLDALQSCNDPNTQTEIVAALQTTITQGFGTNHSLGHGDLGNLDILLTTQHIFIDEDYQEHIQQLTASLLHSIEVQGCLTGAPTGIETPGLMDGLAGIGYALLRIFCPQQMPSVLLLQAPIQATP